MRIGSLFSGYGGLDLAVMDALGGTVAWHCEIDPAAARVLDHHWPDVPNLGDVTTVDWGAVEPVDVLTGGYPCQPFSHAGQRRGTDDERHLWPHVREAIRRLRPRLTVLENVAGHRSMGLDRVLGDMAEDGLYARWVSVRASDVGAPHRRERLFIVAYPADADLPRLEGPQSEGRPGVPTRGDSGARLSLLPTPTSSDSKASGGAVGSSDVTLTDATVRRIHEWRRYAAAVARWEPIIGRRVPPPTIGGRLSPVFVEWMMGLPEGHVTDVRLPRAKQLAVLGNGVVPQQGAHALRLLLGGAW